MKRSGFIAILSITTLLLAGCASTATTISSSAMVTSDVPVSFEGEVPSGSALVVVRFPAVVDPEALDAYHEAYVSSAIGGRLSSDAVNNPDAVSVADATIIKSNYFALSLYKELAQRLPDHSVLLSPHAVTKDENDSLTSEPLTGAESVPSVLTVDFSTYSFPDPNRMMTSEPLTFGDVITPLVVVQTDHRAAAPTNGLMMASSALSSRAAGNAWSEVDNHLQALQEGRFDTEAPELHFVSHLKALDARQVASQSLRMSAGTNAVQIYPLEKISLDRVALSKLNDAIETDADPLERVFSSGFADRIVSILNGLDKEKAAMMQRASSVANFDSNLAALSLVGRTDSDFSTRLKYAERLLDAERKYLSIQSLRIFDGIHNGEIGAQVRDMLDAEWDVLDQRRKLAQQQNLAVGAAILGAIATGVAISESGSNASVGELILTQVLLDAAILATSQAISLHRQSKSVGSNYMASIVPALEEQTSVQVDLIESNETITAIRFEDLQEQLQTLYAENQRSIDTIATSCGYRHDGVELIGKWQGVCANGRAAGPGVGVIQFEDGRIVEYFGEALDGQPNGVGFMIEHSGHGTRSLEGGFVAGQPDGTMKVAVAGMPDRLRVFTDGQDAGPAGPGASHPKLFGERPSLAE